MEAIELSKALNIAKSKVAVAVKKADPSLVVLTENELEIVRGMTSDN